MEQQHSISKEIEFEGFVAPEGFRQTFDCQLDCLLLVTPVTPVISSKIKKTVDGFSGSLSVKDTSTNHSIQYQSTSLEGLTATLISTLFAEVQNHTLLSHFGKALR